MLVMSHTVTYAQFPCAPQLTGSNLRQWSKLDGNPAEQEAIASDRFYCLLEHFLDPKNSL